VYLLDVAAIIESAANEPDVLDGRRIVWLYGKFVFPNLPTRGRCFLSPTCNVILEREKRLGQRIRATTERVNRFR
jgi:hypothetical protein